jgi:hypothetical protein
MKEFKREDYVYLWLNNWESLFTFFKFTQKYEKSCIQRMQ